jgi:predicted ATPase/DNA-binding winged helix-turn-helix (wHTH) protein
MPDEQQPQPIEIRPAERQLLVGGHLAPVGARAFDLLMALVERRDRVVSKNELLDVVWPGLVVEENNLQVQVSTLRKALGPAAIATIPGRGYQCTLPEGVVARACPPAHRTALNDASAPAAAIQDALRGNLPPAPLMFGRAADLAEVAGLMRSCAVVSIVGAGGIGKTRLALALAAADQCDAPDGRWWIELGVVNDGSQIPAAIAGALGLPLPANRPAQDALALALAQQRLLLVLDNCEHLADAMAPLFALLRAQAPGVRLLITSQESLKCVDEQVYRLGPLELPVTTDVEDASRSGAVALFVARARAVDPRFRLGPENVDAVIDICRRLDGIPLAIELAAARVPLLGVPGLQARLDHMFNVLTGVARMKLRRHQTMRAALEWSHGLLSADERAVFRRLGTFAGGFTLELAQSVASDDRIDPWQVLDLLAQLIDKSLVIAEGEGELRYRMLEPTRAFALEQLAAAGESPALLRRHAEAMLAAMTAQDEARYTEPMPRRLARLAELGNLRAALDWAISPGGDRLLASRILGKGWFMWFGNNLSREGIERMLRLWPLPADLSPLDEAGFCLGLASLRVASKREVALQAAQRAIDLYRQLGDHSRLGDALCRLACMAGGEMPGIDQAIAEAATCITAASPLRQQANLAMARGGRALELHDFEGAARAFHQQSEFSRRDGSEISEYMALINLSFVSLDIGQIDAAIDASRRAIEGLRRLGVRYNLGMAQSHLAVALAVRGDDVDEPSLARNAFDNSCRSGSTFRPLMAAALHLARQGDARRAALVAGYARLELAKETDDPSPFDCRLQDEVDRLIASTDASALHEAWQRTAEGLSEVQVVAVAFENAPLDGLLSTKP